MIWKVLLIVAPLVGLSQSLHAQPGSTVDVFPLAIGNRWTYHFDSYMRVGGGNDFVLTDTGRVSFEITGSIPSPDSVRWQFQRRRDIIHTWREYFGD